MIRSTIFTIALAAAAAVASAAAADTIDFGQFGPEGTTTTSPLTGVTHDGVGFTLVGPGSFFRADEGSDFLGDFPAGAKALFSLTPGQAVIYFDSPISSLGPLYMAPNAYEAFTATLTSYDKGGAVLGSVSYSDVESPAVGTNPGFEILGAGIDHVTLATNDPKHGFNIASAPPRTVGGVPEPAAWALMLVGLGGVGASLRGRRGATLAL